MHEATETAKLRLFLKLVSTATPNYQHENIGVEPLPDIDFNIKVGNTLIGFTNHEEIRSALRTDLHAISLESETNEAISSFSKAVKKYKQSQLNENNYDADDLRAAKKELVKQQQKLKTTLDTALKMRHYPTIKDEEWATTYSPFHWIAEFYQIVVERGGFDVIIGNPPYVKLNKIDYEVKYEKFNCPDLYGYIIHRSFKLMHDRSKHGFIVMHNLAFSKDFAGVRDLINKKASAAWFSFYARIPEGLFPGDTRVRNCIYIISLDDDPDKKFFTTRMHRWYHKARPDLLFKLQYTRFKFEKEIPMFFSENLSSLYSFSKIPALYDIKSKDSKHSLFYKQSVYNWISVSEQPAPCYDMRGNKIPQTQVKEIKITDREVAALCLLLLNGRMFYSFWLTFGDEFHLTKDDLLSFRIKIREISASDREKLSEFVSEFRSRINDAVQYKLNAGKKVGTYNTARLWDITDKSDVIFLKYMQDDSEETKLKLIFSDVDDHVGLTSTVVRNDSEETDEEW